MRSLGQSRWLDGEDAVKGLRAASTFFGDGKGVKNSDRKRQLWLPFPRALSQKSRHSEIDPQSISIVQLWFFRD